MKKGYTVIEIIMVIVIIGILAALAAPAFIVSFDNLKIEGAYRQLMQDTRYAQQLAITRQTVHGVSFDPANESYFVYRQAAANIVKDPATQKPFAVTYASGKFSGINLTATTFTAPSQDVIEFNSLGAPSCGGAVTISYSGITKTVSVEPNTGRVY